MWAYVVHEVSLMGYLGQKGMKRVGSQDPHMATQAVFLRDSLCAALMF